MGSPCDLLGGNGAGKSSLIRLLATLNPPTQGNLALFGCSVLTERRALRPRIGLLGHSGQLYDELSPRDHLGLWAKLSGQTMRLELLEVVGLSDRSSDPVRVFSAGMRKRLALARLLQADPDLVLLDEPFGQLDQGGVALMQDTIRSWRDSGKTVVLATHLIERAKPLCDHALVLRHGRCAWRGAAADLTAAHSDLVDLASVC